MSYARLISCATPCRAVARFVLYLVAVVASYAALTGMAIVGLAFAQEPKPSAQVVAPISGAAPKCAVVSDLAHIDRPLPRFAFRLAGGSPIKIVAIGSSSTAGAGASSPAGSYPSRLEVELHRHFPDHRLSV